MPRLLNGSKEFQHSWRPELHFQCCLIEGIVECYFISDADLPKNSDLQATILFTSLQMAKEHFEQKGLNLPSRLRLHTDNASGEGKNQILMKTCAVMTYRQVFDQLQMTMFRVGHTHFKIDQRFSEVRTVLAGAPELQTPQQFRDYIAENLKPRQGRRLEVQIVNASMGFKDWVAPLPINVPRSFHSAFFNC